MSQPGALLRVALLSTAAWACTLLLYALGISVAAASLQYAQTSTAAMAALILIAAALLIACISTAYVFSLAGRYFETWLRWLWIAIFALLQFGTCAVAALATLLVLNR